MTGTCGDPGSGSLSERCRRVLEGGLRHIRHHSDPLREKHRDRAVAEIESRRRACGFAVIAARVRS